MLNCTANTSFLNHLKNGTAEQFSTFLLPTTQPESIQSIAAE